MCHFSFFRERIRIIMKEEEKTSNARLGLSNHGSSQVGQVAACLGARPVVDRLTQKGKPEKGQVVDGTDLTCNIRQNTDRNLR